MLFIFFVYLEEESEFLFFRKKREFYVFLVFYVDKGFAHAPTYPREQ